MSKSKTPKLSIERLREVLAYDAETGVFVWRVARNHLARVGDVAGRQAKDGYITIKVDGEEIAAHRLAWFYVHGRWPPDDIDHRDTDRANNRIGNLREATRTINCQNLRQARSSNRSSGLLGVTWNKGRWTAQITPPGGKRRNLGRFDTPEAAHAVYIAEKRRLHEGCTL